MFVMLALTAPLALMASPLPAAELAPAPGGPVVVLATSLGTIKIGLFKEQAPISVDNFMKYVRSRQYDGTIFHRVIPKFMVQGGGFDPQMTKRPSRPPIKNEAGNGLRNSRGSVAMARTNDPNSATAQFFINVADNFQLDFDAGSAGYAVFGQVLEGMDVVDQIATVPTTTKGSYQNVPATPVLINTAREESAAVR